MDTDLDDAIRDAVARGVVDSIDEAHAQGYHPTDVHVSSETLEALRRVSKMPDWPRSERYGELTLYGLLVEVDDSLRLGAVRVSGLTP